MSSDVESPSALGGHLAVAVAAGALAARSEKVAPAIRDRFESTKRAIARKSTRVALEEAAFDPTSEAHRAALAADLDEHGGSKDRDVVTRAKELLGLLKFDEDARGVVEVLSAEIDVALAALSAVDVEAAPFTTAKAPEAERKLPAGSPAAVRPAESASARTVAAAATSSRRLVIAEESTTELERSALPIWKRTDRFFLKVGILVGSYVVAVAVWWFFIRTPPNDALEHCKAGEMARCWEVVAVDDTARDGRKISTEPLRLLCERDNDPCGCAGLAYLSAATAEGTADCTGLSQASAIDPTWPCTCTRYGFWRAGRSRTAHCGIKRCE